MSKRAPTFYRRAGKRLLDLALGGLLLVLALPVMAVVALVVLAALGRPIFFRQRRPGLDGRPFTLLKFRTMHEPEGGEGAAGTDEDRLVPAGRFLRRWSLDELPELWNVVRGDLSLVGPRPLLMEYLDRYTPRQMRRHSVPPGITGWAQVNGRNALTWEQKLEHDLWYAEHCGPRLDLKILALTAWMLLKGEGISAPGHATMPRFRGTRNE